MKTAGIALIPEFSDIAFMAEAEQSYFPIDFLKQVFYNEKHKLRNICFPKGGPEKCRRNISLQKMK